MSRRPLNNISTVFKSNKETSWGQFVGDPVLKDKYSKVSNVCFLVTNLVNTSEWLMQMKAYAKFSNISKS